jgi:hypothetical protein
VKSVPCLVLVAVLGSWAAVAPGCLSETAFTDLTQCASDADCDDDNPCTADTCDAGVCKHPSANPGMSCGSGLTCNGGGQCAGCTATAECGEPTQCASFTCVDSGCKATYQPSGTALPDTTKGDCKSPACDGKGAVVEVVDLSDVPTSTNPCIVEACSDSGPTQSSAPLGTACSTGVCDDAGACVQCNVPTDCSALSDPYCYDNGCASCSDGKQDGDETNVDCGGSHCGKCGGASCTAPSDCQTNSCIVTAAGDVCGWPASVSCMFDSECASLSCVSGSCTAP